MKTIVCVALIATAIPIAARLASSADAATVPATAALSGLAPAADSAVLRARVERLGDAARRHARRLGLKARRTPLPDDAVALARREARMKDVVAFLDGRRELRLAVDERHLPSARGRGDASALRRAYLRAARLAVGRGLTRPAPMTAPGTPEARARETQRWSAIADWLAARPERVRPGERPLRERVPYYDQLMCIAGHESGARWDVSTGNGYYGGLQMDRTFQQSYAPGLYRTKGTADAWTQEEQMRAAGRAVATRGFSPWPLTARMCGLL